MNKQPLLLAILLFLHSFSLSAQPRDPNRIKQQASNAFNKKKVSRTEMSDPQTQINSNGEISMYAVVVGIGDYATMPPLQYTDDDAQLFFDHLRDPKGGALPESHIRLLIDENATRDNILQALRRMGRLADANDVFIFYFSGHGINGSFLPVDFDGFSNVVRHQEILDILENSRAKQKLCIADACFSGTLDNGNSFASKGVALQTNSYYEAFENTASGTALLMSSNQGEESMEDPRLRHGVFTYFLMRGMNGKADYDQNQIVTVEELYYFVSHNVATYTGGLQSPVLTGDYDNRMPVAFAHQLN